MDGPHLLLHDLRRYLVGDLEERPFRGTLLVAETVHFERPSSDMAKDIGAVRTQARIDRLLESQRISRLPSMRGKPLGVGIGQIYEDGWMVS